MRVLVTSASASDECANCTTNNQLCELCSSLPCHRHATRNKQQERRNKKHCLTFFLYALGCSSFLHFFCIFIYVSCVNSCSYHYCWLFFLMHLVARHLSFFPLHCMFFVVLSMLSLWPPRERHRASGFLSFPQVSSGSLKLKCPQVS